MNWRSLAVGLALLASCSLPQQAAQPVAREPVSTPEEGTVYDEELATKLRANEYGMAQYVMAFLKRRPTSTKKLSNITAG